MSLGTFLQVTTAQFLAQLAVLDDILPWGPGMFLVRQRGQWRIYQITDFPHLVNSVQQRVTLYGTGGTTPQVSPALPTGISQKLAVAFQATQTLAVTVANVSAVSAQLTLVANTLTQILTNNTTFNNVLIKNLDAVSTVEIGNFNFTLGNGYVLQVVGSADDSVWLRFVNPSGIYVQSAGTPKVAILAAG